MSDDNSELEVRLTRKEIAQNALEAMLKAIAHSVE